MLRITALAFLILSLPSAALADEPSSAAPENRVPGPYDAMRFSTDARWETSVLVAF